MHVSDLRVYLQPSVDDLSKTTTFKLTSSLCTVHEL